MGEKCGLDSYPDTDILLQPDYIIIVRAFQDAKSDQPDPGGIFDS
jgi:hypothetical protein